MKMTIRKIICIGLIAAWLVAGCSVVERFTGGDKEQATDVEQPVAPPAVSEMEKYPPPLFTGGEYPEPEDVSAGSSVDPYPVSQEPETQPVSEPTTPTEGSAVDALPGEENMTRGNVMIETVSTKVSKGIPAQVTLKIAGFLPTPCHVLRAEVDTVDAQNRVKVKIYSLAPADQMCTQVLHPLESDFLIGAFKKGNYTIWINGEKVANFSVSG